MASKLKLAHVKCMHLLHKCFLAEYMCYPHDISLSMKVGGNT